MGRHKDQGTRYAKQKGRTPTDRFARLGHKLLSSAAYRALSPNARALLVELAMMENGKNNGSLFLSVRDAADRMGLADPHAAGRAFDELERLGFIACTAEAHFAIKASNGSRARAWRLTWQAVAAKQGPTNDFEKVEPAPKTAARKRMIRGQSALKRWKKSEVEIQNAVGNSYTLTPDCVGNSHTTDLPPWEDEAAVVQDKHTQNEKNGGKLPKLVVGNIHTHTADQLSSDPSKSPSDLPETAGGPFAARVGGAR